MLTDIIRFGRALDECKGKATLSQHPEIAQLWTFIAASYSFLLRREERLLAEEAERDGRSWRGFGPRGRI
jgi:hypothetical protein